MATTHCTHCGTPYSAQDRFCGACGTRLSAPGAPVTAAPVETGDYSEVTKLLAIVAVIFVPLITLLFALVMRSEERVESRREFLKNIAIASAIWLVLGGLFALSIFGCAASSAPPQGPY